jgi:hypothetical protein
MRNALLRELRLGMGEVPPFPSKGNTTTTLRLGVLDIPRGPVAM